MSLENTVISQPFRKHQRHTDIYLQLFKRFPILTYRYRCLLLSSVLITVSDATDSNLQLGPGVLQTYE